MDEIDKSMIQISPSPSKKNRFQLICICLLSIVIGSLPGSLYAYQLGPSSCCEQWWHPVVAIGGGYMGASNLAESQNFPIINPVVNAFYNYSPNSGNTKRAGFVDAFAGVEWDLAPLGVAIPGGAAQFGLGYTQAAAVTVKGALVQGADIHSEGTFGYQYQINLRQLVVEGKLLFAVATIYRPYLSGGIGASFNTATSFRTTVPPFLTFTRLYPNNTNIGFSYFVGVGLDIDLDQVFRVGIGYRFADFGKSQLGSAAIDGVPVPGTISQNHIYANELFAQLTCGIV